MANILIVSGSYFPYASANAVCVKKFEDALKARGHKVIYAIKKRNISQPDKEVINDCDIYYVAKTSDLFFQTIKQLRGMKLPGKMNKAFEMSFSVFRVLNKAFSVMLRKDMHNEASEAYWNDYAKVLKSIIEEDHIDLVVSVSVPFDSHIAVLRAFNMIEESKRPKWMTYCIDAYSTKINITPEDAARKKKQEDEIYSVCDNILYLDVVEQNYMTEDFADYHHKMSALPLPTLDLSELEEYDGGFKKTEGKINIVFVGSMLDGTRDAGYFVKMIDALDDENICLHIMGNIHKNNLEQLTKLAERSKSEIHISGRVPFEYGMSAVQQADITFNIGDIDESSIPSKVIEYMKRLKPVIHFYRVPGDRGASLLKDYPLALSIYEDESLDEENVAKLRKFIAEAKDMSITMEELREIYAESESQTVCKKFCDLAEGMIAEKK